MIKHVLYFIVGLIFWPISLVIAIHSLGKSIILSAKTGYKKGVIKWMKKQDSKSLKD